MQCNVLEIATMKNPWNCQEKFSKFIEAHFIKTNINNKNYEDLVPQLKSSHIGYTYTAENAKFC